MEVAVSGVEHVAHREAVRPGDTGDRLEHVRQGGAGDYGILDHEVARQAPHGAEGLLATLPQPLPLLRVGRDGDRARAVRVQDARDGLRVRRHGAFLRAIELEQQHRRRVTGIPRGVHRVLDRADARLIHHLERGRHDAARDHGRYRLPGGAQRGEVRQQRAHGARDGEQPNGDAGRDPEVALRADEQADEIGSPGLAAEASQLYDLPVSEHDFQGEHVGRRHSVLETMWPARVFGYVAADGAGGLARRIGTVQEAIRRGGGGQAHVHDARFHHREVVSRIDPQDAIQAGEDHQHRIGVRERSAREPGACAAGHERHPERGQQSHDGDHLVAASRKHHHAGDPPVRRQSIARVGDPLGQRGADVPGPDDSGEGGDQ